MEKNFQYNKTEFKRRNVKNKYTLGLAVIIVGNDKASLKYVEKKKNSFKEIGIYFRYGKR